jgi:hypothetical protein
MNTIIACKQEYHTIPVSVGKKCNQSDQDDDEYALRQLDGIECMGHLET